MYGFLKKNFKESFSLKLITHYATLLTSVKLRIMLTLSCNFELNVI